MAEKWRELAKIATVTSITGIGAVATGLDRTPNSVERYYSGVEDFRSFECSGSERTHNEVFVKLPEAQMVPISSDGRVNVFASGDNPLHVIDQELDVNGGKIVLQGPTNRQRIDSAADNVRARYLYAEGENRGMIKLVEIKPNPDRISVDLTAKCIQVFNSTTQKIGNS